MEYYGIKNVEGKAVINEFKRKSKKRKFNFLNFAGFCLAALNIVAYTLIATQLL